jgi:hypothetical protein
MAQTSITITVRVDQTCRRAIGLAKAAKRHRRHMHVRPYRLLKLGGTRMHGDVMYVRARISPLLRQAARGHY